MGSESYDGQMSWPIFQRLPLFACIMCLAISLVSGRLCTEVKAGNRMEEVDVGFPCIQKYSARCGWFSLEYCTFYHHTICKKVVNQTVTFYYAETWCCPGYVMAENSTCVEGFSVPETRLVKMEEKKATVSPGGYAGIACAFVFMNIVIVFIIYGVRKR
ncbi:hypothetical protein CHS0354_025416 [Potamilus streckersoni]|uniref:EMI domain-containing protein n=1 Tax=Potamilus streckersoni TaxID=2493646 RepID=A0AAE0SQF0_9BIVA|nr:hypothetical protein CHS0354_025416 [Potamilus streckersoni]